MLFSKRRISIVLVITVIFTILLSGWCNAGGVEPEVPYVYFATYCAPITNWDPCIEFSVGNAVLCNLYETLLRFEPDTDSFTPVLATDYSVSEDGLVWTFNIRKGVKFYDGTDLTADAVKYSIDRARNMNKGASFIWNCVDTINIVDDFTVEFVLKYCAPLDLIASCGYSAFILSPTLAKQGTDWFNQGNSCGTGPYMIQSQVKGDEVIMTKFPDYWGGWEGEHFDKVVMKVIGENATRRQMVEKGDADIVSSLMVEDLLALQDSSDVSVVVTESYTNVIGFFNTQKAPFDNKLVRQAMCYAFPYDVFINDVKKGFASKPTGPIPQGIWGALPEATYTYDLEKARELLVEAGYPDGGFDMEITYIAGVEDRKKAAELYKNELAKIGVNAKIKGMPWDIMWELAKSPNPEKRQDYLSISWWPDVVSPASWFWSLYHSEDTPFFNLGYYSNPELDRMIEEADVLSGTDRAAAEAMYKAAGQIVVDDAVSIFIADAKNIYVVNKSLKNFKANPAYPYVLFFYDMGRGK